MPGKAISYSDATGLGSGWQPRLERAYAEGRRDANGGSGSNMHQANSPADLAHDHGYTNRANAAYRRGCST